MKTIMTGIIMLTLCANGFAQKEHRKDFNLKKGVAIQGYDPVSYFSNSPKEGKEDINYTFEGITYHFTSEENKQKFIKNPSHYEPQYGGWCAYAIGDSGDKVKIDPKTYKIIDGKVYLFYNFNGNNTLDYWNKREKELKTKADKNWNKITQQ